MKQRVGGDRTTIASGQAVYSTSPRSWVQSTQVTFLQNFTIDFMLVASMEYAPQFKAAYLHYNPTFTSEDTPKQTVKCALTKALAEEKYPT